MGSVLEMLEGLDKKHNEIIAEMTSLHAQIEADGGGSSEDDQRKWSELGTEAARIRERRDHLLDIEEHARAAEAQRVRFEPLLHKQTAEDVGDDVDKRITAFAKAGLPNATEWAPKAIEFSFMGSPYARMTYLDLVKGTAGAGGNLVPTGFLPTLFRVLTEQAAVRETNARVIRTDSGENMPFPKLLSVGAAVIVGEGQAIPESDPAFGQVTLGAYKYANMMQVARELLEDSAIDIPSLLGEIAAQQIADGQGPHLVTGTGTGQPQGVTNANVLGVQGTTLAAINYAQLIGLFTSVRSPYRRNGYWLMNDATLAQLWQIVDTTGQPLLRQGGANSPFDFEIFGRPVVLDPSMPTSGAQAPVILFGDFSRYYVIRDVDGIRFERSDDFAFANDLVSFRVIFRSDAKQAVNDAAGSAVKALRLT
jgi:HK97 family phage major capsid protein